MNDVSLRDLVEEKFRHLDQRIGELKDAIEKLAENTVAVDRFESACHKVSQLEQMTKTLDERLDRAESYIGIWRYIGGAVVTVIVALIIALITGRLGM